MMEGCVGKWSGPKLGFWVVIMLILFLMVSMGCTGAPIAEPIQRDLCPNCVIAPDCPEDFGLEYQEAERAADRLEDAVTAALDRAEACEALSLTLEYITPEESFRRLMRKSN